MFACFVVGAGMNTSPSSPAWLDSMAASGGDTRERGRSRGSAAAARYPHTAQSVVGVLILHRVLISPAGLRHTELAISFFCPEILSTDFLSCYLIFP